jgi:hypothetical protein
MATGTSSLKYASDGAEALSYQQANFIISSAFIFATFVPFCGKELVAVFDPPDPRLHS